MILMLLVAMFTITSAQAERGFATIHGDTTIITNGEDTVRFVGVNGLSKRITAMLDDTLLNLKAGDSQNDSIAQANAEDTMGVEEFPIKDSTQKIWADTSETIVASIMTGITFIVLFSLLFYYLHRRRKYKMVEKAIENNYPLPGYIFGAAQETPRVVYTPMPTPPPFNVNRNDTVTGTPLNNADAAQQGQQYAAQMPQQPLGDQIDWHQMKGGFTTAVTGLAFMLFFAVVGATPLACMFTILLLIGLGKMWLNYQDQKNAIAAWKQQQTWYGNIPTQQTPPPMRPAQDNNVQQPQNTEQPQ